ncbi:MAG: cytochrome C oxidase Cbb3, partial [Phycisphaeraceae bacterium]|nr:cytochrome C oxidase Cbb3 [Phycisphaeraceae bacterium]
TLVRVDADGSDSEIVASGFRAPNGIAVDPDGIAWGSDQEGHWMPANRINRIEPGSFHGNNWSGSRLGLEPLDSYEPPLLWIHPTVDRSPAAQLRVPDGVWGELAGRLLGVSYGTGEVYLILEDEVDGEHQGAFVPLPITLPTGLMRGRFHPTDGSLYVAGLFGWSSDQTDPGGFYRIRRSETPLAIPTRVHAVEDGLEIDFSRTVTTKASALADAFDLEGWNYRWSSDYGSPQLDVRTGEPGITTFDVESVTRSADGRTLRLRIPGMTPAMQMHLDWRLQFEGIGAQSSFIHFTVHRLAGDAGS